MGSRFFGSGRCSIVDVENEDTRTPPPAVAEPSGTRPKFDLVLVSCVKSKLAAPAAAKDLYTSSLFKKERGYAERSGRPWFILSAEHGLVAPDEWLAPYERYLADTTAEFRTAWGAWVAARLELLVGPLTGMEIEVHASSTYLNAVRPHLERLGAHLLDPLRGLDMGQCLAWYPADGLPPDSVIESENLAQQFVIALRSVDDALSPDEFLAKGRSACDTAGLYSWWVDESGADQLSRGLGSPVTPGLIYAGLAGATRWPSGRRSSNTLWLRITTMHLGGNHEFSTFRRTLGSILANVGGTATVDETALTAWMRQHLRVVVVPSQDRDTLGRLEKDVLADLDPPLNLQGMPSTPLRLRLKELRRVLTESGTHTVH